MLNSRKIGVIAAILVTVAVAFIIYMFANPQKLKTKYNTLTLENGQEITFSDSDYYSENLSRAGKLIESTDKTVSISNSGIYRFAGEYTGGIVVNCNSGEVILILDNANVSSQDCAINIIRAEKAVIALAEGSENSVTDGEKRDDESLNGAIFSRSDLVICGEGILNINACFADGINVKDGFKMTGGSLNVTAADEGIAVNDYAALCGGSVSIISHGDGIKCENSDDAEQGFVVLDGTDLNIQTQADALWAGNDLYVNKTNATINAVDDAVHAEGTLFLNGGSVNIESSTEGLEGKYIVVNDGEYSIISSDDAINASGEGSTMMPGRFGGRGGMSGEVYLTVNGGKIYATVGGDGLDSNGAAQINGGYIEVYGPENNGNSTLDFDGGFEINGGTVLAAGASGMAESPSESSKQNSIVVYLSENYGKEIAFCLVDENGEVILEGVSSKSFDWLCLSSDKIKTGLRYSVKVGENIVAEEEVSSSVTIVGERAFSGGGFQRR